MEAENILSLITSIVACISAICNLCIALKNTKKITAIVHLSVISFK
jgi:hypothetical protein